MSKSKLVIRLWKVMGGNGAVKKRGMWLVLFWAMNNDTIVCQSD